MSRYHGFVIIEPDGEPNLHYVGVNRWDAIRQFEEDIGTAWEVASKKGFQCKRFKMKIPGLNKPSTTKEKEN